MSKTEQLEQLAEKIKADNVCPHLRTGATQLVFDDGNPDSELFFIGEAPGENEDREGKPFVGAAGKLLDEELSKIGFNRQNFYITNIVKYRPPGNRDPEPGEVAEFKPYLLEQIEIVDPELVVFLGRHALNTFLPELKISRVHGKLFKVDERYFYPLYHPSAALRTDAVRAEFVHDIEQLPKALHKVKNSLGKEVLV